MTTGYNYGGGSTTSTPNSGDGGGLFDLTSVVEGWATTIQKEVTEGFNLVVTQAITTPTPIDSGSGFLVSLDEPGGGGLWQVMWPIYEDMQVIVTTLFLLAIVTTVFMGVWRERAERRKSIRRLIFWYPIAYWWWWIGGWFLRINKELTAWLLADFTNNIGELFGAALAAGVFAVVVYVVAAIVLLALAIVYLSRWILIHIYLVGMPLLIWLRCLPFKPLRSFGKSLSTKFYPLVMMTIPVAFLLRVGMDVMTYGGESSAVSAESAAQSADVAAASGGELGIMTGMLAPIFGMMIMMLAAIVPKFVFGGMGAISSAAKTASRVGKNAAGGAANAAAGGGGGGSAAAAGGGSGGGSAAPGGEGGTAESAAGSESGGMGGDPHAKNQDDPYLDIGKGRKRKKQRQRSQKLGAAAVGGASSLAGAAKSMGSKAKQGAKGAVKTGAKARAEDGDSIRNAFQETGKKAKDKASNSRIGGASVGDAADRAKSFRENQIDSRISSVQGGISEAAKAGRDEAREENMSLDTSTGQGQQAIQEEQAEHDSFLDERGMNDASQADVGTEMDIEQMTEGEQDMAGERHDQTVSRDDAQVVDGEVYEEDGTYVGEEEEVDFEEDDMTSGNTEEVVEEAQTQQAAAQAAGSQPQPTNEAAKPTDSFEDGQDPVTMPESTEDMDAQKPLDMVAESSGSAEDAMIDVGAASGPDNPVGQDVDDTEGWDMGASSDHEVDNDFIEN